VAASNRVGAAGLAALAGAAGHGGLDGVVGRTRAADRPGQGAPALAGGLLPGAPPCNALVCMAVWMAPAGRSVVEQGGGGGLPGRRPSWPLASSTRSPNLYFFPPRSPCWAHRCTPPPQRPACWPWWRATSWAAARPWRRPTGSSTCARRD
jgi:hypothetical protein